MLTTREGIHLPIRERITCMRLNLSMKMDIAGSPSVSSSRFETSKKLQRNMKA